MLLRDAEILFNERMSPSLYHMGLRCPEIAARIKPGQFLMIRIRPGYDPLLRRPFAVHLLGGEDPPEGFEILYKVVGKGTGLLSGMRAGGNLNLLGPLGQGFEPPAEDGYTLMVAGGIGIAPLPFLAEKLVSSGRRGPFFLWFGGKSAADLLCVEHFQALGFAVELVTEDGSAGRKGLLTDYLEDWLPRQENPAVMLYSCGPYAMQQRVAQLAGRLRIPCQLSMEALMACGVGACLGCSLACRSPQVVESIHYVNVCQQGPVFNAEEIVWESA